MSATDPKRLARERELCIRFAVGRSKFREDIMPKLDRVVLGKRCVAFTVASADHLYDELVAGSANAPKFVPEPNKQPKPIKQKTSRHGRGDA